MPQVEKISASITAEKVTNFKNPEKTKNSKNYEKLPANGIPTFTIDYDFGENNAEAVKLFGEAVVRSMLIGHISFTIQGKARAQVAKKVGSGVPIAQAIKEVQAGFHNGDGNVWKPGMAPARKSSVEKERDRIKGLPPEQRKAAVEELMSMLGDLD